MMRARKKGEGVPGPEDPTLYREHVERGKKSAKSRVAVFMIEGDSVTYAQMAARLGIEPGAVQWRLDRERRKPGPITWQGLSR